MSAPTTPQTAAEYRDAAVRAVTRPQGFHETSDARLREAAVWALLAVSAAVEQLHPRTA